MKIDLSCPVELCSININKETQTAEATFLNLSKQTISAMKYTLLLFDESGEEIAKIPAELENIDFKSREHFSFVLTAESAECADIFFTEITFSDGTVFAPAGDITEVSFEELSESEKSRFLRAGEEDAKCYAKEENTYWLCICGRPNIPSSEKCIKCQRDKEKVLKDYSSEQAVALAILNKEQESAALLEEEKALKKLNLIKKLKKTGKLAAIVIAAILIVFFAFRFTVSTIGDINAKSGNYEKAYSMYKLAGGSKIDKIADKVYGNTPSNLEVGGIITQDDENYYYTNVLGYIYKLSKATGETSVLKEVSAQFLNASGGWLYFSDVNNDSKVYRISPDGNTLELVYDAPVYYLFTEFNNVYFCAERIEGISSADEGKEKEALAEAPIYLLKEGEKEPTIVLDVDTPAFTVYKDRIYYVDYADGSSLKSRKVNGDDEKTLIKDPVYSFEVRDNKIYYTDGSVPEDSQTGMPKLSIEVANLKGKHIDTISDNAMITSFAFTENEIYYTDYQSNGVLFKHDPSGEVKAEAENVYLVNTCGDLVYYLSLDKTFYLSNSDKTGYDAVAVLESPNADEPQEENTEEVTEEVTE